MFYCLFAVKDICENFVIKKKAKILFIFVNLQISKGTKCGQIKFKMQMII